jgi:tripartite-type tricarboxylate transporter receptor subunit TctC
MTRIANGLSRALLLAAVLAAVSAPPAAAQDYPAQDLHFICSFPPGSGADVLVRYFAEKLRPVAGRAVIVENRAGANGRIATEYVARAKPDGYTIYVSAGHGIASQPHFFKNPIDTLKTITPAATINRQPFMMVVDAKSPHRTVADVTAAMKEKGTRATYATAATGGTIMGELYKALSGVQAVEVNYKSAGDSLNDMASGSVDYGMHDPVFALSQMREGRLRILAVSSGARLQASPDLPTMKEQGIAMDLTGWWAAMVPMGTPKPVIDKINQWFLQIVGSDETKAFLGKFGGDPFINTPEQARALFEKAYKDYEEYVRIAKIVPQG